MISDKVMKTIEGKDYVFYEVACACGSPDHNLILEMVYDKDIKMVSLTMYQKLYRQYWGNVWYKNLYKRIKASLRLLFTGKIETEGELLIKGRGHINDFIKALIEGKDKMSKDDFEVIKD